MWSAEDKTHFTKIWIKCGWRWQGKQGGSDDICMAEIELQGKLLAKVVAFKACVHTDFKVFCGQKVVTSAGTVWSNYLLPSKVLERRKVSVTITMFNSQTVVWANHGPIMKAATYDKVRVSKMGLSSSMQKIEINQNDGKSSLMRAERAPGGTEQRKSS